MNDPLKDLDTLYKAEIAELLEENAALNRRVRDLESALRELADDYEEMLHGYNVERWNLDWNELEADASLDQARALLADSGTPEPDTTAQTDPKEDK